jgi:hypothetical protein
MNEEIANPTNTTSKWLVVMGVVWLILAGAIIYYQFATPAMVTIKWDTETELDTAGFYLYRSQSDQDEFLQVNQTLISSEGSSVSGAAYTYQDTGVEAGNTYIYLLEEIQIDGTANRYEDDTFSYTVPTVTWWAVIATAVFIVVGLALLTMGIKELRH